jgi:threonine dehydrogenase-like Zn-dependent dehydrogenase
MLGNAVSPELPNSGVEQFQMQALQFTDDRLVYRSDYPQPTVTATEALIRIEIAGICSTDLEIVKGYAGFEGVLGHEFVGTVESCSEVAWKGRRVVGTINLGCGSCPICLGEGEEHCPRRTVLGIHGRDGAFADYISLPVRNLLTVPDSLSNKRAVFVEPLAAALRIREQVTLPPSAKVAVVGPGRLGLLVGQVLGLDGADVTMLGRRRQSLRLPEGLGLRSGLVQDCADDSFDLIVEATGNEDGFAQSMRMVRPRGTIVLKSTFAGSATLALTKLVVAEINVIGSRCGPFEPALRLLASGAIRVEELIEEQYALRDGLAAIAFASRPGVKKVLLTP